MDNWIPIPDNESVNTSLGKLKSIVHDYSISFENLSDGKINLCFDGECREVHVETKYKYETALKLCGLDNSNLLFADVYWFVLVLDENSTIEFWGDRVLIRKDALQ